MSGSLTLIPTPLDDAIDLDPRSKKLLLESLDSPDSLFIVEEHKVARRRWISWGLPKTTIESFVLLNEHTEKKVAFEIVEELKRGLNAFLLSDAGMPVVCDPGQFLVNMCHQREISIKAAPFDNSIILALSMSGFCGKNFYFAGFPPARGAERFNFLTKRYCSFQTTILMDTPYRLNPLLDELGQLGKTHGQRQVFLIWELGHPDEKYFLGQVGTLAKTIPRVKKRFVLILGPLLT